MCPTIFFFENDRVFKKIVNIWIDTWIATVTLYDMLV